MNDAPERVTLDAFLSGLPPETDSELRAVAGRIDALARQADADAGIERSFAPWVLLAVLSMVIGVVLFFHPGLVPPLIVPLFLIGLPLVGGVYAWRVRDRTVADNTIKDLNQTHFLPHGGLYFAPGERPACVMRVNWTPPEPEPPLGKGPPRDRRKEYLHQRNENF